MNQIVNTGALMGALGVTLLTTTDAAIKRRSLQDHEIVADKELLITAAEVVDSPLASYPGPWSFGHQIEEAFGEEEAPEVVQKWLYAWEEGLTATRSREEIPARERIRELVIRPWQKADGYQAKVGSSWKPNFENAPFQLLAIVNRMDLSSPLASFNDPRSRPSPSPVPRSSGAAYYGGPPSYDSTAGEGRLIFAVTDQNGAPLEPGVTLILEYGLDTGGQQERLLDWAMAWHTLGEHEDTGAAFRGDLAKVTRAFTDRRKTMSELEIKESNVLRDLPVHDRLGIAPGSRTTQLMRIRVNDGAFGETREFREFSCIGARLDPAPLAGTPREVFFRRGTSENRWMARWLRIQSTEEVTASTARDDPKSSVPSAFALPSQVRVRGGMVPVVAHVSPVVDNNADYHWDGWGFNNVQVRRAFSMQTCCGCHCGDTNTAFFHVGPRARGEAAELSKFLRTDGSRYRPIDPDTKRGYVSAEMDLRVELFEAILAPDLNYNKIKAIKESRRGVGH